MIDKSIKGLVNKDKELLREVMEEDHGKEYDLEVAEFRAVFERMNDVPVGLCQEKEEDEQSDNTQVQKDIDITIVSRHRGIREGPPYFAIVMQRSPKMPADEPFRVLL